MQDVFVAPKPVANVRATSFAYAHAHMRARTRALTRIFVSLRALVLTLTKP